MYITDQAQYYLIGEGLVQLPATVGDLSVIYSNPASGLTEPTAEDPVVCALFQLDHVPQPSWASGWREIILSFLVRGNDGQINDILLLHENVRLLWDDAKNLTFGPVESLSLPVLWTRVWRPAYHVPLLQSKSYISYAAEYRMLVSTRALNEL